MHNRFIKANRPLLLWLWYGLTWKENSQIYNSFLFKGLLGNRVCPEASGDTATLWSIRACDGFCIDQENVGWWSGLEGGPVKRGGWRGAGRRTDGPALALGFLWWLPHYTDVVKIHSNLSVIIIFVPAEVIITLSYILPPLGLVDPPSLRSVIGKKTLWEAAAIALKEGRLWRARSTVQRIKE